MRVSRTHRARPFEYGPHAVLAAALLALPALGSLISELLPDLMLGGDASGLGDLPLLAAFGGTALGGAALAGCFGLFAVRAALDPGAFPRVLPSSVLVPPVPGSVGSFRLDGSSPPVLPLPASYFTLLSGLFRPY